MSKGWVPVDRSVFESTLWDNHNLFRLWIWCKQKASHSAVKYRVGYREVCLQPGQVFFGTVQGPKDVGLSRQTFRTCVKFLLAEKHLVKIREVTNIGTIYLFKDRYIAKTGDLLPTNNQPASNQPPTTNKNYKNDQEEVKNNYAHAPPYGVEEDEELSEEDYARFEASFSPTKIFVLGVWKSEREKHGLRYIRSPRNLRAADSIAAEIDAGNWTRDDLVEAARNFMRDDWARVNLTLVHLYEDFEKWLNYAEKANDDRSPGQPPARANAGKKGGGKKPDYSTTRTGEKV